MVTVTTFELRTAPLEVRTAPLLAMVAVLEVGGVGGDVKRPADVIVPTVLFPPGISFTAQVTATFEEPVTVATN